MFGTTMSLRSAFEEQRPWTTATLKNAVMVKLHQTPSHIRFTEKMAPVMNDMIMVEKPPAIQVFAMKVQG
jgi:hypothetical protein